MKSQRYLWSWLSALLCLFLISGCGDSSNDEVANPNQPNPPSGGRVAHSNWNSYNLYVYQNGSWNPIMSLGNEVGVMPAIGDRPAIVVHGLGQDIRSGRLNALANGLVQSGASSVIGFEYDTLDSIAKNGNLFLEAFGYLTEQAPGTTWRIAAHSMGALVTRVALESEIPLDVGEGNRAVFVAGPHTGSEVAEELQDRSDLIGRALGDLILKGRLEFRNADGSLVAVSGQEQGFTDLRRDSQFLTTLNFEAANRHPQFAYLTLAGNARGDEYEALNRILGVYAADGVVNVDSALAPVIGAINSAILGYDHSRIVEAEEAIVAILTFMGY